MCAERELLLIEIGEDVPPAKRRGGERVGDGRNELAVALLAGPLGRQLDEPVRRGLDADVGA